jgi:cyclic pyranopterin phosphate synthase
MADSAKPELSHVGTDGSARMVDVGGKDVTRREALATGSIRISGEAMRLIREGKAAKGNVVETARIAGVFATKRTSELVPLCHPLPIDYADVRITATESGFDIEAEVRTTGKTGVEMEALTAVSVAALTIYDMAKAADKTMVINGIRLLRKVGGRSGVYERNER